jgi:hypothetical protein
MKYQLKNKTIELTDEEVEEIVELKNKPKGVEIKRWDNGEVIYTSSKSTIKEAVEEAVANGISLAFADLSNTNLSDADLSDADLRFANLYNTNLSYADLECAKFYGKGGKRKLKQEQVPDFLKALGFEIEE